jgi:hypothetical protein
MCTWVNIVWRISFVLHGIKKGITKQMMPPESCTPKYISTRGQNGRAKSAGLYAQSGQKRGFIDVLMYLREQYYEIEVIFCLVGYRKAAGRVLQKSEIRAKYVRIAIKV